MPLSVINVIIVSVVGSAAIAVATAIDAIRYLKILYNIL